VIQDVQDNQVLMASRVNQEILDLKVLLVYPEIQLQTSQVNVLNKVHQDSKVLREIQVLEVEMVDLDCLVCLDNRVFLVLQVYLDHKVRLVIHHLVIAVNQVSLVLMGTLV